jgi:RimJ/RimL family protein N-acetyltransferase
MAAYYALSYDDRRVQLTLHTLPGGQADGFVAVCQTGRDLFVPLVVVRAPAQSVGDLLRKALYPGRPYTLATVPTLRGEVERAMQMDWQRLNLIYRFEPSAYRPHINVMVQPGEGPFRFEIRAGDRIVSAAGVNWQSDRLAEMYVYTEPEVQSRGWGRAVGAACARALLEKDILPLYTVSEDNVASKRLAQALGFRDSGAREYECRGQLRE